MIKNVLLIIADDWSPLAGCYGTPALHTPHIDRLAARGTMFTRAFCTTPSCAASRANILTGLYSHQHHQYGHTHGCHNFRTRADAKTLPSVLRASGIASGLVGKSHIAPRETYPFDVWEEPNDIPFAKFSNQRLSSLTGDFLKSVEGKRFYLHAASSNPHRTGGDFRRPLHPEFEGKDRLYSPEEVTVPSWLPDTPETRQDLADYYTYISRFDEYVGAILGELDDAGRTSDTMVLLLSDHGMPFPGAKASPFEAGHHCPLIIAHPDGTGAGQRCDALVNWNDILPTILDGMDIPEAQRPTNLPGESMMPLIENAASPWRETVFYSHNFHEITNYFPYRVIRGSRYKYVRCLASKLDMPLGQDLFDSLSYTSIKKNGGSSTRSQGRILRHWPEALFDLENDPDEMTNLIDDPQVQPIVEDYRNQLLEFRSQTKDPWLEIDHQEGRVESYR